MVGISRRDVLGGAIGGWVMAAIAPRMASAEAATPSDVFEVGPGGVELVAYGWNAEVVGPMMADFHISPDGDDHGPGSTERPFATIGRGIEALKLKPKGSLAIHQGVYREAVSLDALRGQKQSDGTSAYRIHRRGSDRVTLTAADRLYGWSPCPPSELVELDLIGKPIHVAEIPFSALVQGDPATLNLHENGFFAPIASLQAEGVTGDRSFDETEFRQGEFLTEGPDQKIVGLRDPLLQGLAPKTLQYCRVFVYHAGNHVSLMEIDDFDTETGSLRLRGHNPLRKHKSGRMLYRIENFSSALRRGQWIWRQNEQNVRVYFWPKNPANLDADIEVTTRDHCIDFGGASSVELFGIEAVRAAGKGQASGCCIRKAAPLDPQALGDIRMRHCRVGENLTSLGRGYGAIYLRGITGIEITRCTIESCRASFGLFLSDCREADLRGLYFSDVSNSPARFFGLQGGIFAFSLLRKTGWDVHANKFNFYLGSDRILVYGIRAQNTGGYATFQAASRIHFGFCELDGRAVTGNRALVSQNYNPGRGKGGEDGSGDPRPNSVFCFWNLTLLPEERATEDANALVLGPDKTSHRFEVHNCVLHGGGFGGAYGKNADRGRERRSYNRYTGLSFWQTARRGWSFGEGEAKLPIFTVPHEQGRDLRTLLQAEVMQLFPTFSDWNRDIDGRRFNWDAAPIGATLP